MKRPNIDAYELAGRLGQVLEGKSVQDSGAALGMVLAQFILIAGSDDKAIDNGIQAIADDAKIAARKLRSLRQ